MNELEKLYNVLTEKGYYTKSFEEFQDQYSDDSYKKKVYDVVSKDELYTNDYDSFVNKYTSGVKKKEDSVLAQEDTDSTPKVDSSDTPEEELPVRNDFLSSFKDLAPFMIPGASALYEMFSDADYENAIETGKAQGYAVEEISASMFSDKIKTKEDAQKFINAANQLQKVGPSENYKQFQKRAAEYEKEGYGDFSSTLLALGETPEVATETILQSFIAMGPAIIENPVDMLKAVGTGALTGLSVGGAGGAVGGALAGARVGLNVILDSSLSSIEFLKEELEGKDFTPENVLEVMNDKEKYDRIVSRSLTRGSTIGATEAILGKFASGLSSVAGKAVAEVAAGGVGEAAAQVAAGQEINAQEIILESVGGILGVPSAVIEGKANKIYKINGERVSGEKAQAVVDNLSPEEIKDVKIESNDEAFINETKEKKKKVEEETPEAEEQEVQEEVTTEEKVVEEQVAEEQVAEEEVVEEQPASRERVESIIEDIVEKTEARLTPDVDPKKKLSNVLSYLQENSKLYEQLDDSQREKMVIDITKKLGIPVESSPQIKTVLGIEKEAPVNIQVKPFEEFKKRLKELEQVSKQAVKFTKDQQKQRRKVVVDLVKDLKNKGRLSASQQKVILSRATGAVIEERNFAPVLDYIKKVYDNAELAEKLRTISALQKKSFGKRKKKNIQTKLGVAPDLYPQVERIATMDAKNINLDKVDDMLDVLSVLGERKAVLDLAKLKDMSGKIENILSDENVAPEVTPQQAQSISKDDEFMRTEFESITQEEFDSLPEKLNKNIERTRANVAAGFMSPDAIDVIKEVNATRSSKIVLDKINPNKFLDAIAFSNKLRTFLNKSNNLYLSKIRSNSTRYIDDVLGNTKGYEIYRNTFEPLSNAYAKLQGDLEVFSSKKQKAIKLISGNNFTRKANEVLKSSVKMKLTALQFEFEFNENDNSTARAIEWLDATIDHMKEKDFSEHEVKFYEDIKQDFLSDENTSAEQLYGKLSNNEKKAYKIMQDANSDLVGKMLFTSAAVRGERPKTYNSYTYHDVLYNDNEYKGIVENKFQTLISQKPSTKAGTIIDRQPGVRAINLEMFSSSENGARQTLTDYHMTMPVRTLYSAVDKMKSAEGLTDKKKKAVTAISKAVDESLRNVFERDHVRADLISQTTDFLAKVGYRAALGSLPRAASELLSNMEYVMIRNPKDFTKGMQSLKQMTSVDGLELFKSLGSVHTARLFGAQDQVSAFSGKTAFNRLDKNPGKAKGEIYNKAEYIVNAVNNISDSTSYINDTLIQSGDKAVSKPLWFGSFLNKFKELTGVDPDLQKLSENDTEYFKKYKKEIKDSTFYADENVNAAATSLNPFDSILKLQQKQGGGAMGVAKRIYVMADAFMARFTIGEYMQARRAIHSLVYDGKMTTRQAAATLAGTTARMSTYMVLYGLLRDQMRELFGVEPEEEDREGVFKRQLVGSVLGLMTRGTSGNMPMVFINYGLERANEEYMESLRNYEEYDPYKHSIVFSQVTKDEIERGDFLRLGVDVFSGPYTYPLNVGIGAATSFAKTQASGRVSTAEKFKDKLKYVHAIELLGMLNVMPFYKDVRDIAMQKFMQQYPYRGRR